MIKAHNLHPSLISSLLGGALSYSALFAPTHHVAPVDSARYDYLKNDMGIRSNRLHNTIQRAVDEAEEYSTILLAPTTNSVVQTNDYAESVIIPNNKPGMRIIGCGNGPEGVLWSVAATDNNILTVKSRNCYVSGIRFRPNGDVAYTGNAAIDLVKADADAGVGLSDAAGFTVENCLFRSTGTAARGINMGKNEDSVKNTGGPNDITVRNCTFDGLTIGIAASTGAWLNRRLHVDHCWFTEACASGIVGDFRQALIERTNLSHMSGGMIINLNEAAVGTDNRVSGCYIGNEESATTQMKGSVTDSWIGSYFGNVDAESTYVTATNGLIILSPTGA